MAISDEQMGRLKKMYLDKNFSLFFDHLATRERDRRETTVNRAAQWIRDFDGSIEPDEAYQKARAFFGQLAEIGLGRYIKGRRGYESRFQTDESLGEMGRLAQGATRPEAKAEAEQESVFPSRTENLRLRPDVLVEIEIPFDLKPAEAERLAHWVRSLPFAEV